MSSRIDVALTPSLPAGIIAALPWAAIGVATIVLGLNGSGLIWIATPLALAGLIWQVLNSGLLWGATAVIAIELKNDQLWARLGNGSQFPVKPAADSRIGSRITLLKLSFPTAPYSPRTVILMAGNNLPGNVRLEPFRQLRVWLRLQAN